MKIKTKKEMNLPQLIEWGWENPKQVERRTFRSDKRDSFGKNAEIYFTNCGHGFYTHRVTDKDTFTVEVEEEITEDMKLYLVERYISSYEGFKLKYRTHPNRSIKSILEYNQPHLKTTHVYAEVNNELTLIWTYEKGLVD
ncbi:hypothetical protein [Mammaliicoccus lentus]|uniref:hypothetical protein n=1 Tax=Mammaliicoccus lentus TaxID=42858 RepID=UPI002B2616D8|nr:hypothetical protein [Mammaliicoccus lentus]WQK49183.1 hypothetical protein P3U54_09185 [Mammaliicoccus lentus]